tara:strand:+ start:1199 stop:1900 length:702 start_codon:yes stop_codon:yes gene_type:complete
MNLRIIASVTAFLALGACEYTGPAGDPVSRNLSWFDYVGAEGLRDACAPGASTRLRFVYNGIYDKQIRTYDIFALPGGRGATMSAWARGTGDLTQGVGLSNILSPWQGKRVESVLDPQTTADLLKALDADRFRTFKPVGLRLPSNEFYWIVTGCLDGRFHANAWMYPSDRFKGLRFPAVLVANDRTGVDFRKAVPVNQRDDDPTRHQGNNNPADEVFEIQLGPNRIVGARGLF